MQLPPRDTSRNRSQYRLVLGLRRFRSGGDGLSARENRDGRTLSELAASISTAVFLGAADGSPGAPASIPSRPLLANAPSQGLVVSLAPLTRWGWATGSCSPHPQANATRFFHSHWSAERALRQDSCPMAQTHRGHVECVPWLPTGRCCGFSGGGRRGHGARPRLRPPDGLQALR